MRSGSIVKYVFTAVGFGMLIGAYFLYKNTNDFLNVAQNTQGTVVGLVPKESDDSTTYAPTVEFETLDGSSIAFTSSSSSNPPSYSRGEVVTVFYLESDPEHAKIDGFFTLWGVAAILGGMGSIFFLIGLSMLLSGPLKNKKIAYLKAQGVQIKAQLQGIEINRSVKVNGRNPYQIIAQWKNPTTSKLYVFSSDNIWFDPTEHIDSDEVFVLIEKNNPKKYHIDLSFLPELVN